MTPYDHLSEYLLDEIGWVRSIVRGYLDITGRRPGGDRDLARTFAVTSDEAARLLRDPEQIPRPPGEAALLRARIDGRVAATRALGRELPLPLLVDRFGLDDLSRQVLALALVGELDEDIRRLYQFCWNDLSRRSPTIEFLLGLLQPSSLGRLVNAHAFFRSSPLVGERLLETSDASEPYLGRAVRIAPSVVAWSIGGRELDPGLAMSSLVREATPGAPPLVIADRVREPIDRSLDRLASHGSTTLVVVGPGGTGKTELALRALGRVVEVDLSALVRPAAEAERRISALRRDARLLALPIVLDVAKADPDDPVLSGPYRLLARVLDSHPHGVVVTAHDEATWFVSHLDQAVVHHIPLPSKEERETIWLRAFTASGHPEIAPDVLESAVRYPLSGGSIERGVLAAAARAESSGGGRAIELEDVTEACRAQLTPRLSGIAQRIVTTFTWDDLILPPESADALREIVAYARNRSLVYDTWGYGRLLPYGRGLSALFAGPPGTGKTMAAGIIAGELGMEVFRVDLSRTVSKYIGETEKNLGRIFDEAAKSQSILLFDEADSLFAKRTSVKSSVDRYANLEVNYLLQRMEDFEGVTILTTNLEGSLDDAFRRRIRFRVEFPAPDAETRGKLWERMVPPRAQVDGPLDFLALGEDYELSGGHIKNGALRAAFFAAEEGRGIVMRDLRRAARLESLKLGKIVRVLDTAEEDEDDFL